MMNQQYIYILVYSQYWYQHAVLNLILQNENYCIIVFYSTLKRNHIILYHIWYLLHDEPSVLYIFQNTPSIDFKMVYWIKSLQDVNLLYYSILQHPQSLITSFCIIFDICNMINYRSIYIPEYSQYWFQHAVINLITTRREFTLLQYYKTLWSIITSFCIIFNICYMMNQ